MPKIEYKSIKFQQKSLELIKLVNQVVEEYQAQGYELTLRQAYYQLVARGYIPNNERSYKNIGNLINDGRLAGLIDWHSITDRTRNLRSNWLRSDARYLLNRIPKNVVEWIYSEDMTDEEKAEHPTHETTGGYLKVLDESDCGQLWWGSLSDRQKNIIKALPNFDPEIFEQCTGINVNE